MFRHALDGILYRLPDPLQISTEQPTDEVFSICRVNLLMTLAHTQLAIQRFAVAMGEEEDPSYQASTRRRIVDMLESMSSESLAANGDALRNKVLYFVMSSMLEPASEEVDTHTSSLLSSVSAAKHVQADHHSSFACARKSTPMSSLRVHRVLRRRRKDVLYVTVAFTPMLDTDDTDEDDSVCGAPPIPFPR
jgi:hypothetical protein